MTYKQSLMLYWLFARKRSWWNRLPLARQWRAAVAVFLIVGAGHAAFGLWWASKL